MQVKKYWAKTIEEATAKVKNALGADAMIISTRKLGGKKDDQLFEIAAAPAGEEASTREPIPLGELKSELMNIKEMIYLLNHDTGIVEKLMMSPVILDLYTRLIRNGVNEHYARLFLEKSGVFREHPLNHGEDIKERIITEIMHTIKIDNPFEQGDTGRVIAAFIGTTGVGKTTTIAKLAAQLMLKAKKKVGLISIDNYRIGAMEQLKTYANILGIPCYPAFNRRDLLFALKRMEGRNVVLIDTAGQSQYDRSRIGELRKMICGNFKISSHLLLSVATTESEMHKIAINFAPLKFQSYIFTKIDESERCGSVINQIMKLSLPISYMTTGQNVPEDIEKGDKARILNLLLNKN